MSLYRNRDSRSLWKFDFNDVSINLDKRPKSSLEWLYAKMWLVESLRWNRLLCTSSLSTFCLWLLLCPWSCAYSGYSVISSQILTFFAKMIKFELQKGLYTDRRMWQNWHYEKSTYRNYTYRYNLSQRWLSFSGKRFFLIKFWWNFTKNRVKVCSCVGHENLQTMFQSVLQRAEKGTNGTFKIASNSTGKKGTKTIMESWTTWSKSWLERASRNSCWKIIFDI